MADYTKKMTKAEADAEVARLVAKGRDLLHKASPAHPEDPEDEQPCISCRHTVKRGPGGQDPTWVHVATAPGRMPHDR